jgi:hypothetical protein
VIEPEEKKPDRIPGVARGLGRAGLLPFCGIPVLMWLEPHHRELYVDLLANYALAIISFLVGVWWGLALIRRTPSALLLSNAVVIVAFFGRSLLTGSVFFLLCAALFSSTVMIERRHPLFRPQPLYYARLRMELTIVATIMLLCAAWLA